MKALKFIIILSGAVCIAACSKEENALPDTQVCVSMPEALTKTSIGPKSGSTYPLYWTAGDQISMNGNLSMALTSSAAGSASATFEVKTGSSPFNVIYPGVSGVDNSIEIASAQTLSAGAIASGVLPMYASAASLSSGISMKPLGTLVRFALKGSSKILSISITADGGENVCGKYTVGKTSGALNGKLSLVSGSKTVTASSKNGISLSLSSATYFYVVITPATYSKGLHAAIVSDEKALNAMEFSFGKSTPTLAAGTVVEVPEMVFEPQSSK